MPLSFIFRANSLPAGQYGVIIRNGKKHTPKNTVWSSGAASRRFSFLLPVAFLETRQSRQADARTVFEKTVGVALHLDRMNSRKSCSKVSQLIGLAYDFFL